MILVKVFIPALIGLWAFSALATYPGFKEAPLWIDIYAGLLTAIVSALLINKLLTK